MLHSGWKDIKHKFKLLILLYSKTKSMLPREAYHKQIPNIGFKSPQTPSTTTHAFLNHLSSVNHISTCTLILDIKIDAPSTVRSFSNYHSSSSPATVIHIIGSKPSDYLETIIGFGLVQLKWLPSIILTLLDVEWHGVVIHIIKAITSFFQSLFLFPSFPKGIFLIVFDLLPFLIRVGHGFLVRTDDGIAVGH